MVGARFGFSWFLVVLALFMGGCTLRNGTTTYVSPHEPNPRPNNTPLSEPVTRKAEPQKTIDPGAPIVMVDEAALDRSVDPCQDFYEFSCGGWMKSTELPADKSALARSFNGIRDQNLILLKKVLEGYATGKNEPKARYWRKLGTYYASCMDEDLAEAASSNELPAELKAIDALQDKKSLPKLVSDLHAKGVSAFFGFYGDQDDKDANQVLGYLDRGGISLPDRDYYLDLDDRKKGILEKYREHIAKILRLAGMDESQAAEAAPQIIALETELAELSLPRAERRDPVKLYNPMSEDELAKRSPSFDWKGYLRIVGTPGQKKLMIPEPRFIEGLSAVLERTDLEIIKSYLRWQLVRAAAPSLGAAFQNESFDFFQKTLQGQKEIEPRWKRCVARVDQAMGEALGEAYVKIAFDENSKADMKEMVEYLKKAFERNLSSVDWMDEPTREAARVKLRNFVTKIGYPDQWKSYRSLKLDRMRTLGNVFSGNRFRFEETVAKIGKPVDRAEWRMSPPTVNAYHNPTMVEIVFPAGILQSPFYSPKASKGANYGAIGMVIGHEISHGFDDQGRQYDATGNLNDWWSPAVSEIYNKKAECIVEQYAKYEVPGGIRLNGKLTLGENIGDLGGLKLAHLALQIYREAHPERSPAPVAGFSEEQQFFVAFAQGWCSKRTPQYEQERAVSDPHSPPRYRVNGVVVNTPEFAKAFGCQAGAPMAPVNRCQLW